MDNEKMGEYLVNIPKPVPRLPPEQERLKLTILNSKRSSVAGAILIILPGFLIFIVILQNIFHIPPDITRWLAGRTYYVPLPLRAFLFFLFLVGFPFIAVILNLLAITYYKYNVLRKEVQITIRMKWPNILIAVAGAALASFYILHLLADTLLMTT